MSTHKQRVDAPRVSKTAAIVVEAINEMTKSLVEDGFIYFNYDWHQVRVAVLSNGFINAYGKQVCKDLGRPWVRANGGYYVPQSYYPPHFTPEVHGPTRRWRWHLSVPKKNYLAPLVAPLLMVAQEDRAAPVSSLETTVTNWEFAFGGDEGKQIWESQMHFMRNDPACRKALRVPPK